MTLFEAKNLLQVEGEIGFVRLWIDLADFPTSLKKGLDAAPLTEGTEKLARELVHSNFATGKSVEFVRCVCRWGGDSRRGGKVIAYNSEDKIASCLRMSYEACLTQDRLAAINYITTLEGLSVSFGSKHLKFLDPEQHVVLDSIISEALGFSRTPAGYLAFSDHCRALLDVLKKEKVPYSGFGSNGWRLADVEMAIYNKIKGSQ